MFPDGSVPPKEICNEYCLPLFAPGHCLPFTLDRFLPLDQTFISMLSVLDLPSVGYVV